MLLLLLTLVHQSVPDRPQGGNRDTTLALSAQLFGAPVEPSPHLFSVNRFYVLRVQFAKDGQLEEAAVEPRFYFADTRPDWEEPDNFQWLSEERATELLANINRLRPLGKLVRTFSGIVFVTNLTARMTEDYESADVTRGAVVDIRRSEDARVLFRFITVKYKTTR